MRTYRIYSLSNVQAYHTAVFIIVILYIAFPVPIGLKTGSLYLLTTFLMKAVKMLLLLLHPTSIASHFFITSPLPTRLHHFFFSYKEVGRSDFLSLCFTVRLNGIQGIFSSNNAPPNLASLSLLSK